MDLTAAEISEPRRWAPRRGVGTALGGLAILAGVVFALIPFEATPSQPRGAAAVDCGRAVHAFRSHDTGPALRKFLSSQSTRAKDAPPPSPDGFRRL